MSIKWYIVELEYDLFGQYHDEKLYVVFGSTETRKEITEYFQGLNGKKSKIIYSTFNKSDIDKKT